MIGKQMKHVKHAVLWVVDVTPSTTCCLMHVQECTSSRDLATAREGTRLSQNYSWHTFVGVNNDCRWCDWDHCAGECTGEMTAAVQVTRPQEATGELTIPRHALLAVNLSKVKGCWAGLQTVVRENEFSLRCLCHQTSRNPSWLQSSFPCLAGRSCRKHSPSIPFRGLFCVFGRHTLTSGARWALAGWKLSSLWWLFRRDVWVSLSLTNSDLQFPLSMVLLLSTLEINLTFIREILWHLADNILSLCEIFISTFPITHWGLPPAADKANTSTSLPVHNVYKTLTFRLALTCIMYTRHRHVLALVMPRT